MGMTVSGGVVPGAAEVLLPSRPITGGVARQAIAAMGPVTPCAVAGRSARELHAAGLSAATWSSATMATSPKFRGTLRRARSCGWVIRILRMTRDEQDFRRVTS